MARRICLRLDLHDELDDLFQCGMLGLVEASLRFEPARAESFWRFARHRVSGAMFDELRRLRASRRWHETQPSGQQAVAAGGAIGGAEPIAGSELSDSSREPGRLAYAEQLRAAVSGAMEALSLRDTQLLELYYFHGMPQAEIAAIMQVSESRIHQIRTTALGKLRSRAARNLRLR